MELVRPHVLVVGAGVSGLTTALELIELGAKVTIVTERMAAGTVSTVAGALWEWPPAVCGYHHDQVSLARSKRWCMESFWRFAALAACGTPGVYLRTVNFYFSAPIERSPDTLEKMREIQAKVPGFNRLRTAAMPDEIDLGYGIVDGYRHLAPMIDTDVYLRWLQAEVQRRGVAIEQRRLTGTLRQLRPFLLAEYAADALVCCAGLGTAQLRDAEMYPLRGALIRMRNDGTCFPRVTQAHCVSHVEGSGLQDIVFIVPRGENMLVLGGLAEPDQWDTQLTMEYGPVRDMYEHCLAFMPMLAKGELDPVEPVRTGLRPFRRANVCLEYDHEDAVVYNYAHGGAGFSFSWGCAHEAAALTLRRLTG